MTLNNYTIRKPQRATLKKNLKYKSKTRNTTPLNYFINVDSEKKCDENFEITML